jgi:hypothetical protein
MITTFYRADPATIVSVQCSSMGDVGMVREALARAIEMSGRDIWTWKPGRLVALRDDGAGRLVCTWADRQSMAKYHRYLDMAWETIAGCDDLDHVVVEGCAMTKRIKLRVTITIDLEAADYQEAALIQSRMEAIRDGFRGSYGPSELDIRERRDRK